MRSFVAAPLPEALRAELFSVAQSLAKSFRCWFVSWRVSLSNFGAEGNRYELGAGSPALDG